MAAMAADPARVVEVLTSQSRFCADLGSPFSEAALELIALNVEAGGGFATLLEPWADWGRERLISEAVALRVLGGLHDLVLAGADLALASEYPSERPDLNRDRLAVVLDRAAQAHRERLLSFMASPPQTNEVRRCAGLLGGFLTVAQEWDLPLRCLEIGASAGLNLNWRRFRYDLGAAGRWGEAEAPLSLATDWRGPLPPLQVEAKVVERAGCDQNPIDPGDPEQARRLQAYVWADQTERLDAVRRALAVAQAHGVEVERADAGAWTARRLAPADGAATVLYHSVVWQYLGDETRAQVQGALAAAAAKADTSAPLAWLRMEPTADYRYEVRLTMWPGGEERLLAEVHPHGAWVAWRG